MLCKTLKHKTLKGTYGVFIDIEEGMSEIGHSELPELRPYTCTMEGLVEILKKYPNSTTIIEQLKDYDMVVSSIMIIEKE